MSQHDESRCLKQAGKAAMLCLLSFFSKIMKSSSGGRPLVRSTPTHSLVAAGLAQDSRPLSHRYKTSISI